MITINSNDVLAGRGTGSNQFEGNVKFRALVEKRKLEYNICVKHKEKKKIAYEILSQIHERGGRFLKLTEESNQVEDVVENGVWQEETEKEALDKIKMCLRQKVKKADAAKSKKRDRNAEMDRASKATRVTNDAVTTSSVGISAPRNTMVAPALRTEDSYSGYCIRVKNGVKAI